MNPSTSSPGTPTERAESHDSALEGLALARTAQIAMRAVQGRAEGLQAQRRTVLRAAVAQHGPSKVSAALGISRQALRVLIRAEGTSRDRVAQPTDPAPTGPNIGADTATAPASEETGAVGPIAF